MNKIAVSAAGLALLLSACSSGGKVVAFKVDAPATAQAGVGVVATITAVDSAGKPVSSYSGTVTITSSDALATVPAPVPLVGGSNQASVLLKTVGTQTITATSGTITGSASLAVAAGPFSQLQVAGPTTTNVNSPFVILVLAKDQFGNEIHNYTGTVSFTSTDPKAKLPAAYTFTAANLGEHALAATFGTLGAQTLTATDAAANKTGQLNVAVSSGAVQLAYTNPPAGTGKVALMLNAAASTPATLQLDLVAVQQIPAAFSAGLDLPAAAGLGTVTLVDGNAFNYGAAPKAEGAKLANGVLYSVASQKAGGAGAVDPTKTTWPNGDTAIPAGAVLYSLQVSAASGATSAVIFDGANLGPQFKAAVLDRTGNASVRQADFAIGRLELK